SVQGLCGGALLPAGQAVLADLYDEEDRARIIGIFSSIMPFGSVAGPFLGGIIVEAAGWRWTFLVGVPIMAAVLIASRFVLQDDGRRLRSPIDYGGGLLLLLLIPSMVLALAELGQREASPNMVLVVGGATVAIAAL